MREERSPIFLEENLDERRSLELSLTRYESYDIPELRDEVRALLDHLFGCLSGITRENSEPYDI
jgi:hypothetical protein